MRQKPTIEGLMEALTIGPVAVGIFVNELLYFYDDVSSTLIRKVVTLKLTMQW